MLHFTKFAAAATAAMLAATVSAAGAGAQGVTTPFKPFSLGVSAGASIPTGDLSNNVNTGYNVTGHIGVAAPSLPVSFRGDVGYNNWGAKASGYNDHAWGFTANALVDIPVVPTVHPYIIGGIGGYRFGRSAGDVTVNDNTTRFGYNIGGGITLPLSGFNTFVEARYNHANRDFGSSSFVPITFGVMF